MCKNVRSGEQQVLVFLLRAKSFFGQYEYEKKVCVWFVEGSR